MTATLRYSSRVDRLGRQSKNANDITNHNASLLHSRHDVDDLVAALQSLRRVFSGREAIHGTVLATLTITAATVNTAAEAR